MARAMLLIGFAAAASADTGPSARQLRGYAANAITAGARRLGTAYCIDAGSDGNPNTGDQIIVWECNGQAAQEWIWAGDSSGNYYIKYKPDTTKCMTVKCDTGKSDCSGTPVTFEDCTDSSYQHFGGANGHIYFQGSSQVVDAGAWPLSNGLGLYVYDENGNPQQNWEYGDDLDHFYNSDSQAALAAEETPTALPPSEDVNTTTEDAKLQHQHLQARDDCPYSDGFNIKDLVCLWQYQNDYAGSASCSGSISEGWKCDLFPGAPGDGSVNLQGYVDSVHGQGSGYCAKNPSGDPCVGWGIYGPGCAC